MFRNIWIIILVLLIIPNSALAASSQYDFIGYASSLDLSETGLTFNYSQNCDVQMSSRNSFVSAAPFSSTLSWRSPDSNILGVSTLTGLSNTSCLSYGQTAIKDTSQTSTETYESSWSVSHSASSGFVNTQTRYICDSTVETTAFTVGRDDDSRGFCVWRTRGGTGANRIAWNNQLLSNYNSCGNLNNWAENGCLALTSGLAASDRTLNFMYPFNSSGGFINYTFSSASLTSSVTGGTPSVEYTIVLLDLTSGTKSVIFSQNQSGSSGVPIVFAAQSGNLTLTANRLYLFSVSFIKFNPLGFTSSVGAYSNPIMDLSIFTFEPNYVCGSFGDCINGTQSRVCVDSLGVAPDLIETQTCFDTPSVDLRLGFEEFDTQDVYTCQSNWLIVQCLSVLNIIEAKYPRNWTVVNTILPDATTNVAALENYVDMSQDFSTEGSSSLKMWYIPPKPEEPINSAGTAICGNATIGKSPEVDHPYNESLFVMQNVSFASPFVQLRFDVKKCQLPVVQYDYTGDFIFNCGKRCYSTNCTAEPRGRYGIRLVRLEGQLTDIDPQINVFSWNNINDTVNTSVLDGVYTTNRGMDWSTGKYENITIIDGNTFENGTVIQIFFNSTVTGGIVKLIDPANTTTYGSFNAPLGVPQLVEITLSNITSPVDIILLTNETASPIFGIAFDYINVKKFVNLTTSDIVVDYFGNAQLAWQRDNIIDLSNVGLEVGVNYTIAVGVNPENSFDSNSHCIFMDNFRATYTETALPSCETICQGLDLRLAQVQGSSCVFTTIENSPICAPDTTTAEAFETLSDVCIGTTLHFFNNETGLWDETSNSDICIEEITDTVNQSATTRPLDSAETWVDWILFLVSPIFIYFFIILAISSAVGAFVKAWEAFGVTFAFGLFVGMLITLPNSTAPIIPIWVGIAMIVVISLLLAAKLKSFGFGGG